jgi:hypothetical protein
MMKIAELRKYGAKVNREGMSQAAIDAINAWDGSYKGAMQLCGQLSLIAKAATCDDYWSEQVEKGKDLMEIKIERELNNNARK